MNVFPTCGKGGRGGRLWSCVHAHVELEGATSAITASFIRGSDQLLEEPLSDWCWCSARKQPSASVSEVVGWGVLGSGLKGGVLGVGEG